MRTKHGSLTGEAKRQRAILAALALHQRPADRTRTSIAKAIAGGGGTRWKNMYSGVFNDVVGSLMPQGLIEEEGRLPYGRGPKAVQKAGIPYYRLTRLGRLACLALDTVPDKGALLGGLAADAGGDAEKKALGAAAIIAQFSSEFVSLLFGQQARAYSEGSAQSLVPGAGAGSGGGEGVSKDGLAQVIARFISGLDGLPVREKETVLAFLRGISQGAASPPRPGPAAARRKPARGQAPAAKR